MTANEYRNEIQRFIEPYNIRESRKVRVWIYELCDELEKAMEAVGRVKEWRDSSRTANPLSHWNGEHIAFNLDGCLAPLDKTDEKGEYTPWPIREIVKALAGATTHLFDTHDCDIHGYELWKCALEAANKYLAPLNPDYAQMVDDDKTALEDA